MPKRLIIPIACLTVLDQGIKLVIHYYFLGIQADILGPLVRFYPIINHRLSWFGSLFGGAFANLAFTLFINVAVLFVLGTGYLYYLTVRERPSNRAIALFSLGIAGCLCSFIDKLLWGGSLDFIYIKGLFIFDLKDCFLTIAEVLAIYLGLFHYKTMDLSKYFVFVKGQLFPSR